MKIYRRILNVKWKKSIGKVYLLNYSIYMTSGNDRTCRDGKSVMANEGDQIRAGKVDDKTQKICPDFWNHPIHFYCRYMTLNICEIP